MTPSEDTIEILHPPDQKQKCPVCQQPATFKPLDHGRKRRYSCPTCIAFIISPDDEEDLQHLKQKERDTISKNARECDDKTILHILTKRTLAHDQLQVYYNTVEISYEPKCNWL